jgi:UPF0716 protein FxsA
MPLLVGAFIVIPILELYVIIQVGQGLGIPETMVLLLLVSLTGAWLCKHEGLRAWRRFRAALDEPRIPTQEVVDGALVLLAGALMLTPGFLTDIVGLLLVLPPTRAVANRLIRARVRSSFGMGTLGPPPRRSRVQRSDEPIDVEVVEVKRSNPAE